MTLGIISEEIELHSGVFCADVFKIFFGAGFRARLIVSITLGPVLMMTYTTGGTDSLWLWWRERLIIMECVKWRPKWKEKWTGEKRKYRTGFGIIYDFILAVVKEASVDLGIY